MTSTLTTATAPVPRLVDQFEHGLDAPICLTWELTYACNLSCVHCLSSSGRRDPRELSTDECFAVIDELQRRFEVRELEDVVAKVPGVTEVAVIAADDTSPTASVAARHARGSPASDAASSCSSACRTSGRFSNSCAGSPAETATGSRVRKSAELRGMGWGKRPAGS